MAAIAGEDLDRLPVCFWHHFKPAGSGRRMAEVTFQFFIEQFDLDILKIMPDIAYPIPRRSIQNLDDWRLIEPINNARSRFFNQRNVSVQALRDVVGYETPIVMTVFSPLCEALHFVASYDLFFEHYAQSPAVIHEALATMAENLRAHMQACINAGADGIFFALQGCTDAIMSRELYRELGRPYDLLALQGVQDGWLNILHVHGNEELHFEETLDYPVSVMSWSDRLAGPSLADARALTDRCLMGGWHEFGALSNGPVESIREEAEDAIRQTDGRKLILANGCSVPDETPEEWLVAAREIVETLELS